MSPKTTRLSAMVTTAAWRLRRPELDMFVARTLSFAAWAGVVVGGVARQLHGRPPVGAFVLAAVPAFVARAAAVICLGTGAGLLLMVFRLSLRRDEDSPHRSDDTDDERDLDDERAWQLEV
jgi:hypothetical protein